MREAATPYVLSLTISDSIYVEPITGKVSILGILAVLQGKRFPRRLPQMCLHVELTDGRGRTRLLFRMVDDDETIKPLFSHEESVQFSDPRQLISMGLVVQGVVFPGPGEYRLQLFANGTLLTERRLLLTLIEEDRPNEEDEQEDR